MIAFIWQRDWEALGSALAQRLIDAGYDVTVFIRSGQKSDKDSKALLPQGARQAKSLVAAIEGADTVLTLLSTPQEVEDVYLGEGGVFEKAAPLCLFIDLSTSNPRLAKELYALAAVHDHGFIEAPFLEGVEGFRAQGSLPAIPDEFRILAASEPDNLEKALPVLQTLTPRIIDVGLPGSAVAMKLASQIALAGALMGVVEAVTFATLAGVEGNRILEVIQQSAAASTVAQAFGKKILDEEFYYGCDLRLFFNDLTCAIDAADELELALPGLETAHQLYDLLVLVGGGQKGLHALALIYYDEERCTQHGLNWELAQRAMDVYERANDGYDEYGYDDDYDDYDDEEECDDPNCGHSHRYHLHHHDDDDEGSGGRPSMKGFFSPN
jgi:3-hydroxyisobutyrate dehydrogenase